MQAEPNKDCNFTSNFSLMIKNRILPLILLLPIILFTPLDVLSQSDDPITYKNGEIHLIVFSKDSGDIIEKIPIGNNLVLTHKPFFKSYTINYDNENGINERVRFSFVQQIDQNFYKMKDVHGEFYFLTDELEKNNSLDFAPSEPRDDFDVLFVVTFDNSN
ncbi:MAG: hypothetical protein GVX78_01610 [Bacteroidetes bacterium]|jgi:hypothetical protein|nr:hypothetical protein [Bacteroidota bacterium]